MLSFGIAFLKLSSASVPEMTTTHFLTHLVLTREALREPEAFIQTHLGFAAAAAFRDGLHGAVASRENGSDVFGRRRRGKGPFEESLRRGVSAGRRSLLGEEGVSWARAEEGEERRFLPLIVGCRVISVIVAVRLYGF